MEEDFLAEKEIGFLFKMSIVKHLLLVFLTFCLVPSGIIKHWVLPSVPVNSLASG